MATPWFDAFVQVFSPEDPLAAARGAPPAALDQFLRGLQPSLAAPDATATRAQPLPPTDIPQLEDFRAGAPAVAAQEIRHRPVQGLAKLLAASVLPEVEIPLPLGGGVVTRKTPNERLRFEMGLARQNVEGRMFDDALRRYFSEKRSAPNLSSLLLP